VEDSQEFLDWDMEDCKLRSSKQEIGKETRIAQPRGRPRAKPGQSQPRSVSSAIIVRLIKEAPPGVAEKDQKGGERTIRSPISSYKRERSEVRSDSDSLS